MCPSAKEKPEQQCRRALQNFIAQQDKPKPPVPVKIEPPKPLPIPSPKVARKTQTEAEKNKPLTAEEKQARETASQSGLLALSQELADLIDTSDLNEQVGGKIRSSDNGAKESLAVNADIITSGITQGSGGVSDEGRLISVGSTELDSREIARIKQALLKQEVEEPLTTERRGDNLRTTEEVTIVFDQHKGQLYSLYNRERRKQPGLEGKVVVQITISPAGAVTDAKVVSTELNSPRLEARIIARVKQFKFAAKDVETLTVTYPIEFLPS